MLMNFIFSLQKHFTALAGANIKPFFYSRKTYYAFFCFFFKPNKKTKPAKELD